MLALVFVSLLASTPSLPADAPRAGLRPDAAGTGVSLSGRRLASTADRPVDEAPTSSAVAAIASYAATGTGVALALGFFYLLKTSEFAPPRASSITAFSLSFLLLNFGPNVGDLLNGDVARFGAHGGLRLLLLAVGPLFQYAWVGWLASMVVDLGDARSAPERWTQRSRGANLSADRGDESPGSPPLVAITF
jgi:hypothetical protein